MDSISIETRAENDWVKRVLREEDVPYIWTGGRKCNFRWQSITELTADQGLVTCVQGVWQGGSPARHWERLVLGGHRQEDPFTQVRRLTLTDNKMCVQEMPLLWVEQDRGHRGGAAWQQGAEAGRLWRGLHRGPQQLLQGERGGPGALMGQMYHFLSASQTEDKSFVKILRCHDMRWECIKSTRESGDVTSILGPVLELSCRSQVPGRISDFGTVTCLGAQDWII